MRNGGRVRQPFASLPLLVIEIGCALGRLALPSAGAVRCNVGGLEFRISCRKRTIASQSSQRNRLGGICVYGAHLAQSFYRLRIHRQCRALSIL